MTKLTTAEQFCYDILSLTIKRAKALVNIIMALGSESVATNPTSLSLSPLFQYHYLIIGKATQDFGTQLNGTGSARLKSKLQQKFFNHLSAHSEYKISTDFTNIRKPESSTLVGRGFVNIPNIRICGNKPIDTGYYISYLNLHLYDETHPSV